MVLSENPLLPIPICDLGDLVAENDNDLKHRYIENSHYSEALTTESRRVFFIGRKGFGKSALLQMLRLSKPKDQIVDLGNQDIGLDLLVAENALEAFPSPARGLLLRSLWKAVLMRAIYDICGLKWSTFGRTNPQKALDAIMKGLAHATGASSIPQILRSMIGNVRASFEGRGLKVGMDIALRQDDFAEKMARTDFLHQIHLAAGNLQSLLREQDVYVLIDDLDQGWSDHQLQNEYLTALFETVEKFSAIPRLKFVISLRLDIFTRLSLQDPDKLVQRIHRLAWSPDELRRIIEHRIHEAINEPRGRTRRRFSLHKKSGHPIDNILARCFPNPRDAIWTFQQIFDAAAERQTSTIDQTLVDTVLQRMSADRVRWICSEWSHSYSWLPDALSELRGVARDMQVSELRKRLKRRDLPDPDQVMHGLMVAGIVGMKTERKNAATYFFSSEPHSPPYRTSAYAEIHSAVSDTIQRGDWRES